MFNSEDATVFINLLKTIIGCGLLVYPSLIYTFGLIPPLILSVISAFFSGAGLLLYAECNNKIGKKSTMSSICNHFYPPLRAVVDICVSVKCFMVGILYALILKKLIPSLFQNFAHIKYFKNTNLMLFIILTLSSPLSYYDKLSKLRFTSSIGIVCVFIMLVANTFIFINTSETQKIEYFTRNRCYLTSLGGFVYGFTCHQNIFTIQNEMARKDTKHLSKIIFLVMVSTILIYFYFGIIGHLIFASTEKGLDFYVNNNGIPHRILVYSFFVMILLSFPLQSNPCRLYSLNILGKNLNEKRSFRITFTTVLLIVTFLIAVSDIPVEKMLKYIGGTVSAGICFIFAFVFYSFMTKRSRLFSLLSFLTFSFGIFVVSCSFYEMISTNN